MSKRLLTTILIRLLDEVENNYVLPEYYDCEDFYFDSLQPNYAIEIARNLKIEKATLDLACLKIRKKNLLAVMEILWLYERENYFDGNEILDILIRIATSTNICLDMTKIILRDETINYNRLNPTLGITKCSTLPYCYSIVTKYAPHRLEELYDIKVATSSYFKLHMVDYYLSLGSSKKKIHNTKICSLLLEAIGIDKEEYIEIAENNNSLPCSINTKLFTRTMALVNQMNCNSYVSSDVLNKQIALFICAVYNAFGVEIYENSEVVQCNL